MKDLRKQWLLKAAKENRLTLAKILLAIGANLESQDYFGRTPLHLAAIAGSQRMVNLLLAKKARVLAIDARHWTPLHYAAYYGWQIIARRLLAKGAAINALTAKNETPLALAVANIHLDMARLLEKHGGKPILRENTGRAENKGDN